MNRYVSPERRRRQRMVDGPEGEEPAEFTPQRVVRVMCCPKCRETIATMRRWRMACNECGHEWEEETVLTTADKLEHARTEAAEFAVMALMWAGLLVIIGAVVGLFLFIGLWLVGVIGGIVVAGLVLLMLLGLGGMARARNERMAQYAWWSRGWRDHF
jgi:hypothetical protein